MIINIICLLSCSGLSSFESFGSIAWRLNWHYWRSDGAVSAIMTLLGSILRLFTRSPLSIFASCLRIQPSWWFWDGISFITRGCATSCLGPGRTATCQQFPTCCTATWRPRRWLAWSFRSRTRGRSCWGLPASYWVSFGRSWAIRGFHALVKCTTPLLDPPCSLRVPWAGRAG